MMVHDASSYVSSPPAVIRAKSVPARLEDKQKVGYLLAMVNTVDAG